MLGMIWNSIVDHIPMWGWLVIFGVPTIVAGYYLSPILLPIWRVLPAPVKGILLVVGAGFLAYLGGRHKGRENAEEEERRRNAEALRKRAEVDNDIGKLSGKETDKKLHDRWGRDDP